MLCESFIRRKTKKKVIKGSKSCYKGSKRTHIAESCLPMKRSSISRRNPVTKMVAFVLKVVMRQNTKFPVFRGVINPISNGLVWSFVRQYNPDSFLQRQYKNKWLKNEWWGLPSYVKLCLTTFGGYFICGWRWEVLSFIHKAKKKCKNGGKSTFWISSKRMRDPPPVRPQSGGL